MDEFAITKRCETHWSWYCECAAPERAKLKTTKSTPPPPTGLPKLSWRTLLIFGFTVQLCVGAFSVVASKFGEDVGRRQMEMQKLRLEVEQLDRQNQKRVRELLLAGEKK